MATTAPQRVQAGVPTGGQFASTQRAESSGSLDAPRAAPVDVASLVAEIRGKRADRDREMEEMRAEAERTGLYDRFDEASADYNEDADADLERLLDALEQRREDHSPAAGPIAYADREMRVEGGFGEVIVSPRDPASGPGTIVMVDTAGQTDGQPVVVMINDEVYRIPVESDDFPDSERCSDCGRHVDSCLCADRSIGPEATIEQLNRALDNARSHAQRGQSGADAVVHRLSAHAAARMARDGQRDARYLNLDWGPSGGLEPVSVADAFGDSSGPLDDEAVADLIAYTRDLHADGESISPSPLGSKTPYRLDIDSALGEGIW